MLCIALLFAERFNLIINKEDIMNHALLQEEETSVVNNKPNYYLSSLMPEDIIANVERYYSELMLTKLKVAQILALDFNTVGDKTESLSNQYKEIEELIVQFSREIKPALIKKFSDIAQYAYHFRLYYPYFKEEIQQVTTTSPMGYKAVIAAMSEHIPQQADEQATDTALYPALQNFMKTLQQQYASLHSQVYKRLDDRFDKNVLQNLEKCLQQTNDQLEASVQRLLSSALSSGNPINLSMCSAREIVEDAADSPEMKKQNYYLRQYEENLQALAVLSESEKNLFLLTLAIKCCLDRLAKLAEALKEVDNFWEDSQKSLKALEIFIKDNNNNEAQNYLLRYIDKANLSFELLTGEVSYLLANTSIKVPPVGHINYLRFVFLLQEPVEKTFTN